MNKPMDAEILRDIITDHELCSTQKEELEKAIEKLTSKKINKSSFNVAFCPVEYLTERGYVEMVFGAFGLHRKQGYYRPFKDWLEDYELEIIGNIYENPELLEVSE